MSADPRAPKLRTTLTLVTVGLASIALLVSAALVLLTTVLHETSDVLEAAVESVRLAEETEVSLLLHGRAVDSLVKRNLESDVRRRLAAVRAFATSASERRMIARAESQFEHYLAVAGDPTRSRAEVTSALDDAYAGLEALVEVQVAQARAAHGRAADWNAIGNVLGALAIVLLLVVVGGSLYWLWARAFQPLFALAATMDRFARGDRDARLSPSGAQELRSMVQRWNEMADALAVQQRAQRTFLAGVAHDLRNPLSALKLSLAAIPADRALPPEPRIRRTLATLDRQLTRLERLVGDILDIASTEAGELELQRADHDLRAVVSHVAELFEAGASGGRLEIRLPDEPVRAHCDAVRIEQVLSNLVSNAFKYSPQDAPVVLALRAEREHAIVEVVDRGSGIGEQDRAALFEPFRRGPLAAERASGLGLGLFMVRRIVDAHGGRIEVESTRGQGSTFRLHLTCLPSGMLMADGTRG